jgi:hypothetical protein
MIFVSLAVNVLVLVPVCTSLLFDVPWARPAYGDRTPARSILLSIYAAILIVSSGLILGLALAPSPRLVDMTIALLIVQIIYKVTTPWTVGSIANPVVLSNLAIAALHLITVSLIWN